MMSATRSVCDCTPGTLRALHRHENDDQLPWAADLWKACNEKVCALVARRWQRTHMTVPDRCGFAWMARQRPRDFQPRAAAAAAVGVASQDVQVSDIKICYSVFGSGPTRILCVMGWTMPMEAWSVQLRWWSSINRQRRGQGLPDEFSVCVLDNRNIGGSGVTKAWLRESSIEEMAGDAIELCVRELGWDSFNLCGVSMGGMISLQLAHAWPQFVNSLTVINSNHAGMRGGVTWPGLKAMARVSAEGARVPQSALPEFDGPPCNNGKTHAPPASEAVAVRSLPPRIPRYAWVDTVDSLMDLLYGPFLQRFDRRDYFADVRRFTLSELVARRPAGPARQNAQLSAIVRWSLEDAALQQLGALGFPITLFCGDSDVLISSDRMRSMFEQIAIGAKAAATPAASGAPDVLPVLSPPQRCHRVLAGLEGISRIITITDPMTADPKTAAAVVGETLAEPSSYWVSLSGQDLQLRPKSNAPLMVRDWKHPPGDDAVIHCATVSLPTRSSVELYVFEDCGHWMMVEAAASFNRLLTKRIRGAAECAPVPRPLPPVSLLSRSRVPFLAKFIILVLVLSFAASRLAGLRREVRAFLLRFRSGRV